MWITRESARFSQGTRFARGNPREGETCPEAESKEESRAEQSSRAKEEVKTRARQSSREGSKGASAQKPSGDFARTCDHARKEGAPTVCREGKSEGRAPYLRGRKALSFSPKFHLSFFLSFYLILSFNYSNFSF